MSKIIIRQAAASDATHLNHALRQLSDDLGDEHLASDEAVAQAGFGTSPSFSALLAEDQDMAVGVVMFSPVFSTIRGAPGVFVSDLWVSQSYRGQGIATRLLSNVCSISSQQWGAAFMRLNVYNENQVAISAYEKLGFKSENHETIMTLAIKAFDPLSKITGREAT